MSIPLIELAQLKPLVVSGLAAWLSFAVMNNILDFGTNRFLLAKMLSMQELKEDADLGRGLTGRAVEGMAYPSAVLRIVIVAQLCVSLLLWRGAWHLAFTPDHAFAVGAANLGLGGFICLWFLFLIGGMYHGYWIKMPQVQQVHLALVIISIGSMILVNMR